MHNILFDREILIRLHVTLLNSFFYTVIVFPAVNKLISTNEEAVEIFKKYSQFLQFLQLENRYVVAFVNFDAQCGEKNIIHTVHNMAIVYSSEQSLISPT